MFAEFLLHLFRVQKLAPGTDRGYRAVLRTMVVPGWAIARPCRRFFGVLPLSSLVFAPPMKPRFGPRLFATGSI